MGHLYRSRHDSHGDGSEALGMRIFGRSARRIQGGTAMVTSRKRKTVLITAPSTGLGREFSKLYAANGYRIIMVDGSRSSLETLADSLEREHGTSVRIIAENLTAKSAAARIIGQLKKTDLRVDEILTREGFRIYGPFTERDLAKEVENVCAEYRPAKLENRAPSSTQATTFAGI